MRTAVAFYSRFGHTEVIGRELVHLLGAEPRPIVALREHSSPALGLGALLNLGFALKPMNYDFSQFDLVVVCTPVWAGRPACPTRTFVKKANLAGKRVAVVLTTRDLESDPALTRLDRLLTARGARVERSTSIMTRGLPEGALRDAAYTFAQELARALYPPEPAEPPLRPQPRAQPRPAATSPSADRPG